MSYCPACGTQLTIFNTPLLSNGKLANGEKLCKNCNDRLSKLYDPAQIHTLTPADVKKIFVDDDTWVDDIITQIENTGVDRQSLLDYWNTTELQYLPNVLTNDETIVAFANGVYADISGIIVGTTTRLFFLGKPPLDEAQVTDFEWQYVDSVQSEVTDGYAALLISYSGDIHYIENVSQYDADRFCNNVAANIEGFGDQADAEQQDNTAAASIAETDVPAQLEKYADLKNKGVITQAEFDAKKKKLLGL